VKRFTTPLCLAALMTAMVATPALAAPPTNDAYGGSVTIGGLPFTDTVDTSEATTDADDAEWNMTCGAPATDASVWYEYTATSDDGVIVDATESDYTVGISVVTGAPGSFELVACGPDAIGFSAVAGETYSIIAFDDQFDGGGNGGMLTLLVDVAPPPPEVDVTVDPVAHFDPQSGSVTVTGTVTCVGTADFSFIDLQLEQRVGRFIVRGFGFVDFACDGTTQEWSAEVIGDNGLFKGGRAATLTFAVACNAFTCGEDVEETTIHLRG
jgi:Family of unknown function (DUF6299)